MLGPGCWSIRVACSPGANCLEDLITLTFVFFSPSMMPAKKPHVNFAPLSYGKGHSGCSISVLMTLQSPIIKHTDWTSSTLSRREALGFAGSPRISEWSPVNYLLMPRSCLDLSEFNMDSQFTPFTTKSKLLGIRWREQQILHFCRGKVQGGVPHRHEHAAQFSSCQGARADPGMTTAARTSRGLGGAWVTIAGRTTCLFKRLLASAGFANLAMPSGWAEPGGCQASRRLPGSQKCFRGYGLQSRGIRPWRASWRGVAGLLILPLSGSGSWSIPTFPKVRWAHPKGWLFEGKEALLPRTHPPPPLHPPHRLRVHPVLCLPPGPSPSAVFSN